MPRFLPDHIVKEITRLGILNLLQLEPFGVMPVSVTGAFFSAKVPLWLVSRHPGLHVVSIVGTESTRTYVNRHVPGASLYYVADGDSNPSIEIVTQRLTLQESYQCFAEMLRTMPPDPDPVEHAANLKRARNIDMGLPINHGLKAPRQMPRSGS